MPPPIQQPQPTRVGQREHGRVDAGAARAAVRLEHLQGWGRLGGVLTEA
jgi:hypothetical protein